MSEDWNLGLSAGIGALQFAIDGTRIDLDEEDDPALFGQSRSQVLFDASFSALLHRKNFYFGVTLPQLLQNEIDFYDSSSSEENKLEDHYYVISAYTHELNSTWSVQPAVLVKYVSPVPVKIDASVRVIYNNKLWLGSTYRTNDAISVFLGYEHNGQVSFGYAYDFTNSSMRSFSDGTHELTLAFKVAR